MKNSSHRYNVYTALILAAVLFASALGLRVYRIGNSSIWMDEDMQAKKVLETKNNVSMVRRAAAQQQPPIDYYAEEIFLEVFGVTELGARFHAALWGALGSVLFFLLILEIIKRPFVSAFFSLLFVFDSNLIFYSQEGRPISCGVFFAVLYLLTTCRFLSHKGSIDSLLLRGSVYYISNTLFLLSVGFQPLVFCFVTVLSSLPLLAFRNHRVKVVLLTLFSASAFFTALPILKLTIERGVHKIGDKSLIERAMSVLENIGAFQLESWTSKYSQLLGDYYNFALLALALGLLGLLINFRRVPSRVLLLFLYFALFVVLYPGMFDVIYSALIDHNMKYRYYLTFMPVLLTLTAIFGYFFLMFADRFLLNHSRAIRALPYVLLVSVFVFGSIGNFRQVHTNTTTQKKTDWRSMYEMFKTEGQRGDIAFMMNLVPPERWQPGFYGKRFYYNKNVPRPVKLKKIKSLPNYFNIKAFDEVKRVYFVTAYGHGLLKEAHVTGMNNVSFHDFDKLSVIEVESPRRMKNAIRRLFATLNDRVKRSKKTWKIFEVHRRIRKK